MSVALNRKKPSAGTGSYTRALLMMDICAKEEEMGLEQEEGQRWRKSRQNTRASYAKTGLEVSN